MDNTKTLHLNLSMSPRAIDELKQYSNVKYNSKYELPLIMFPDNKTFEITAAVIDGKTVCLGFIFDGKNIVLSGSLEHNNFFCTSVTDKTITDGRKLNLVFLQEKSEDFTYINEEIKQRFAMWYDYIESMQKKAEQNSYKFTCDSAEVKNEKIIIITSNLKPSAVIRNLSVGFLDEKNQPSWGFGKVERYESQVLFIQPFGSELSKIMSRLTAGTHLIIYDGAVDITCKRMKSGLDKLCRGESVNRRLPEFLFDPKKANREIGENVSLTVENLLTKTMNPEQISAVEGALNAEDLYLIQGPPGTGKTTVIAEICYQNAVRGLKTLIVSQSNLAVDNAISRVMNHADIRVLRKGDALRVEEEGLPFVEDNVVRTWISQISEATKKMDKNLTGRLTFLKESKERFPELLELAENIKELEKNKNFHESQLYFFQNVLEDAKKQRAEFFELITDAYENDDLEKANKARDCYPPDFKLPNSIYNDLEDKYMDIKADLDMIREYEADMKFYNEYTEKFVSQFRYITETVSSRIIERTAYEGVFYYADREMVQSLYEEGERILDSEPYGIKRLIFGHKWNQVAAIYYRRAENLIMSIQLKTIRICEKIYNIRTDREFTDNVESFHFCLDALGEDYDAQYYSFKGKYEKIYNDCMNAVRDYKYSVEYFKEHIKDDFYSAALKNIDFEKINLDELEYNVSRYYSIRYNRYKKWKKLLDEWRNRISDESSNNYSELKKLYIDNANVIGITCIQSGTKDFNENYPSFDVVIIDEASKSTPPDIILPMLKGRKIILVGDHKQLPPFIDQNAYDEIEEDDDQLKKLIKVSLFEELYEKSGTDMRTMLFRQYRMHKDIAALINQFYVNTDAGRLESPASEFKRHCCQGRGINADNHVIWYDVPNIEKYYEKKNNKSYSNEFEAECIKKILCLLEKNLTDNNSHKSIGIITFYDAQVKLIEEKLINNGYYKQFGHITLRIGSVDRFQGMEEDIILISFARNNNEHAIGFARDSRRINVALSRAKELLIIVGSSDNFIKSGNNETSKMFENVYNIIKKLDGLKNAEDLPELYVNSDSNDNNFETSAYESSIYQNYNDETEYGNNENNINILDYFILKAALEFKNEYLSVKNISNVLGIAPVFIKNRVQYLKKENLIEYRNQLIQIKPHGEEALNCTVEIYKQ